MGSQFDRDLLAVIPGVGITYGEFARIIELNTKINLRVGLPGEVVAWYPPVAAGPKSKPAMVDVQPHFISTIAINSEDEVTAEETAAGWVVGIENGGYVKQRALPVFRNVRVHFPGSAAMSLRNKLRIGEVGWLKVCDRSLDKWTQTGGPVDPGFAHYHDFTDSVFEPGLRYGTISTPLDETKAVLGPETGSAGFEIDDVEAPALPNIAMRTDGEEALVDAALLIKVGAQATEAIAKAESLIAAIDAMLAAGTPLPNDGGVNLLATMTGAWNGVKNTIKAIKGRVE